MSNQFSGGKSVETLSVGNVVSAGLRVYRDNFKLYYLTALKAYLWIIVPVYGWAKFSMLSGLISRLAFAQVNEHPETESEARAHVEPRLWNFFVTGLLVGLIIFAALLAAGIIAGIIFYILGVIFGQNAAGRVIIILLGIIAFLMFLFGYIWIFSRISIAELPIAIDDFNNANDAIQRSWKLTQGYVLKLQLIFFVSFLLSLPISIAIQIVSYIAQLLPLFLSQNSGLFAIVSLLLNFAVTFAGSALLVPFWQSIKAVIYYDLRSRKEGMGLDLRKT